jgi:competence ComEA-like helix-hairpin-helix protein
MPPEPNRRLDPRWTGANLRAATAVCLAAALGLALTCAAGRFELGDSPAVDPARVQSARERVNPNTAGFSSLRRLPELGPVRAQAIVDYLAAHGPAPFQRPEDLEQVRGIGPATAQAIRDYLDFGPPPR